MTTAVKSAFDRINKEYATTGGAPAGSSARSGAAPSVAPPVRPTGPSPDDPSPFGYPGAPGGPGNNPYAPGGYTPDGYAPPQPGSGGPWVGQGGGGRGGWGGGGWGGGGGGRRGFGNVPPAEFAGTRPFSATRTYDKLTVLVTVSLVCGIFGYLALPTGLAFVCVVGAFIASMVAWFNVRWSKYLAPTYAVLQGLALGTISSLYATVGHGIVPVAIVFTGGLFVGALLAYRTGLVRVTPRMVSFALMGAIALCAVFVLSLLGLSLPGVNSFGTGGVIFGLIMLAIAMANLFTDFEYVRQSERLQVSSEAEWAAALAMMTALVLVYLSILRIVASMYGGGGRRN
ncbi:MAG: Bax inhibitor-1/YccA family protein [Acidimicrobiaceae bacterium]|nr:Bax inhibitor-1/YccA family protein [Acidimicrobiaceae bacterium]